MSKFYIDAGTTWSKIIELKGENSKKVLPEEYLLKTTKDKNYYILPSRLLKNQTCSWVKTTGHMSGVAKKENIPYVNEVIALSKGILKSEKIIEKDFVGVDLGSRDIKWVRFEKGCFRDLDWNTSCAGATGATVEMLLKFYDVKVDELEFNTNKYNITCGIYGLEKIMDDIANGENAKAAISKFVHGIAFNAWIFAKKPDKLYLSGGFCDNKCFVESLSQYCEVIQLGRFALCEGIVD